MDPATLSVSAIAAAMALKMAEKTGESLSEATLTQVGRLFAVLRARSLGTAQTLEALPARVENPFDIELAQQQLQAAIIADAEVAEAAEGVGSTVENDPLVQKQLKQLAQDPQVINNTQLAETINGLFQGNVINNPTFNY